MPVDARQAMIAKLHIGKTQLGWDDATYRAVLERFSGHRSSKKLSAHEMRVILDYMRGQGFDDRARKPHKARVDIVAEIRRTMTRADNERADHAFIRALWKWLSDAGVLYDPYSLETSLDNFVQRQTGTPLLIWLPPDKCASVTEALKKWVYRVHAKQEKEAAT